MEAVVRASPERVARRYASRNIDAGAKEWLQWIVQPLSVLYRNQRKFIQGPVDDAMDQVIREIAPVLVREIIEREIEEDITEFQEGAIQGQWDASHGNFADPVGPTDDWVEGYEWGFANPGSDPKGLNPRLKKTLVEEAADDLRGEITEQVVIDAMEKAWGAVNPKTTFESIIRTVKKYGWKAGLGIALVEIVETFVMPAALIAITGDPKMSVTGMLPLSEVMYAVAFRFLGRVPGEADDFDVDGHLDWYEGQFGPVRVACLITSA